MSKTLHLLCYAEGRDAAWEAFCVSFDLAVQGRSFDDVYRKLNEQIDLYLETVAALPAAERRRFLRRRAPLAVRLRLWARVLLALLFARNRNALHAYDIPRPIAAAAT